MGAGEGDGEGDRAVTRNEIHAAILSGLHARSATESATETLAFLVPVLAQILDEFFALERRHSEANANLAAVQKRCSELIEEARAARRETEHWKHVAEVFRERLGIEWRKHPDEAP